MVKRIGPLVFGQRTRAYFLALLFLTIAAIFFVPVSFYIYTDHIGALLIIGAVVWLTILFVYSFKTNPTAFNKVVKWVSCFVLIISTTLLILDNIGKKLGQELVEHGVETQAILLDKEVTSGRSSPPQYVLTVQFHLENKETVVETFKVPTDDYTSLEINQTVPIRYSRRYPALIYMVEE